MELILVRHGQSQGNISTVDMPDPPLTALGEQQAASVSRAVAALKPDILAASPLHRALQTATPAARELGLPIEVWKEACEVRTGPPYIGPSIDTMCVSFPEAIFGDDMETAGWHYNSDLNLIEARRRADRLVLALQERYVGKRLAIFLHGTLNQMILQSILGMPTFEKIRIHQPNGCIHRILFQDNHIFVHSIADITHLIQDDVGVTS
ncbi:histidine phosphatase family protein [Paenibacillus spongiae]|uniref:Histidine phosphatase family protein n=1 Tax=Paenibacillus spongiae TaxID=2909671 RepID=A0ABY5SGQ4_9BACL|nr:histidine phosphatase family protein [Paenibacillus spongiae]UVI33187.1 histidine phosphatase family protein [Paenibacillus spongiae]